jgi:hypothetical protein
MAVRYIKRIGIIKMGSSTMKEYTKHLEFYQNYKHSSFSTLVPSPQWGNKQSAQNFLQKYWLPEQEYLAVWKPIQDCIFDIRVEDSKCNFQPEFELIKLEGGCLFLEEDFKQLQQAMTAIGETHFVVIQSAQDFTQGEPMFRMKFPVAISWEELMSGNYISAVLFEMNRNEYLVFGNSGKLGKYAASDQDHPQDIIGYKPILKSVMGNCFNHQQL